MVRYIDGHKARYGVEPICAVLPIAPSTYYEHKARESDPTRLPPRRQRDMRLKPEVSRVWHENQQVYGARKVWKQLNRERFAVARCTVRRLMGELGLRGAVRGREIRTTFTNVAEACPADRVNRQFQASRPVVAFPESPARVFSNDRLERRNELDVSRHLIHARLVKRRPRQPGCLAGASDRDAVLLGHDPDGLAPG